MKTPKTPGTGIGFVKGWSHSSASCRKAPSQPIVEVAPVVAPEPVVEAKKAPAKTVAKKAPAKTVAKKTTAKKATA